MKRILLAALCAVGLAAPAFADLTYYVNTRSTSSNQTIAANPLRGLSANLAFLTPTFALAQLQTNSKTPNTANGHIILIAEGNLDGANTTIPSTWTATDGKRLFIYGPNQADPSKARLKFATISLPYVSISCMTITGSVTLDSIDATHIAQYDSVTFCAIPSDINVHGDYSVFFRNTIVPLVPSTISVGTKSGNRAVSNVFRENTITIAQPKAGTGCITTGYGVCPDAICDSLLWTRNVESYTQTGLHDVPIRSHFNTYNSTWSYNVGHYHFNTGANTGESMIKHRDADRNNTWNAESLYIDGSSSFGNVRMTQCCNGNHCGGAGDQVRNWTIDSCLVINTTGQPALQFYSGCRGLSLTYSTLVTSGATAFEISDSLVLTNTINHNTFVGSHEWPAYTDPSGPEGAQVVSLFNIDNKVQAAATFTFTNNLVVNMAKTWNANVYCAGAANSGWASEAAVLMPSSGTASVWNTNANINFDFNAYCNQHYGSSYGDRSISYATKNCSKPGNNTGWDNTTDLAPRDSNSVTGLAFFGAAGGDTMPTLTFDPHIGELSCAKAAGSAGSDIGAVAYGTYVALQVENAYPTRVGLPITSIDVGSVATNTTFQCSFRIVNTGTANLTIGVPAVSGNDSTYVKNFSPGPLTIAAGASSLITFDFVTGAIRPTNLVTQITMATNDPRYPTLAIDVRGRASGSGGATPDTEE